MQLQLFDGNCWSLNFAHDRFLQRVLHEADEAQFFGFGLCMLSKKDSFSGSAAETNLVPWTLPKTSNLTDFNMAGNNYANIQQIRCFIHTRYTLFQRFKGMSNDPGIQLMTIEKRVFIHDHWEITDGSRLFNASRCSIILLRDQMNYAMQITDDLTESICCAAFVLENLSLLDAFQGGTCLKD